MNPIIKFNDLEAFNEQYREEYLNKIDHLIKSSNFILGSEVELLENKLKIFTNSKYVIGVSSGTDALLIALIALGIKPGDEIIVPAFTFIATSEVVSLLGAIPIFCDIYADDLTINIDQLQELITPNTKAVIAVSLFGQCPDFVSLKKICHQFSIPLIEDGAQSLGAKYENYNSCSIADISTTSFFPAKPLGCFGDGGAIFTNNEELYILMKKISRHGQSKKYKHEHIGINGRLDALQAAILNIKIDSFEYYISERNRIYNIYMEAFETYNHDFTFQKIKHNCTSTLAQFIILTENREESIKKLIERKIPYAIHYPLPLNKQPVYLNLNLTCPIAERISGSILSLPFHTGLSRDDINYVVSILNENKL